MQVAGTPVEEGNVSELEKIRALSFLSVLTIMLIVLFALQSRSLDATGPATNSLQTCATSKGALCPEGALSGVHSAAGAGAPAEVGATLVTTPRLAPAARTGSGVAPVAFLGEMTVVADRLPTNRLADLAELRRVALHLSQARESVRTAQTLEF